jgi:hypothetical protein
VRFFFDNTVPKRIARAIAALYEHEQIVHLRDRFPQGIKDVEWISELAAEEDWVIITHDPVHREKHQKEALRRAGHTVFFLKKGWGQLDFREQAKRLVGLWEEIVRTARQASRGECFWVTLSGKFEAFRLD